jgi:hypothetical protein
MPNQKAIIKLVIQQSCVESTSVLQYAVKWTWIDWYGIGQKEHVRAYLVFYGYSLQAQHLLLKWVTM